MAVREVLQLGNPLLREVSEPVEDPTSPEVARIVEDLRDTLAHWRATTTYGRGIAAPQIGVLKRIVFLNLPELGPWPLINPTITAKSPETMVVWDACLSFLSIFMQVERHREVTVRYQDLRGTWHEVRAGEAHNLSELLQHEIDHLDGILAIDRVVDVKTIVTRQEFERRYRAHSPYAR
ncbi:peptide deformylase [Marinithermus hydrothermalis]|uniref:Peptide deformylase n=1 Tax=Marinithermus hydrothermalis (strain DSM 14884 / JCM 11576 / T1) TaxID=869210 RepID=F2NLR4_MARHT|nr:peptide deformylase [Marinithermus hydrothermalis]AEB10894.1 Peptide deformylase [Marinithermus hydrothermalis DSM 14884]